MKILPLMLSVALALGSILSAVAADGSAGKKQDKLRHVVAFKFKTSTTPEQVKQVENAFRDLKKG